MYCLSRHPLARARLTPPVASSRSPSPSTSEDLELDPPVARAAFVGGVVGDRLVGTFAQDAEVGSGDAEGGGVFAHCFGAGVAEGEVGLAVADVVGVADDLDAGVADLDEAFGHFGKDVFAQRGQAGAAAFEFDDAVAQGGVEQVLA